MATYEEILTAARSLPAAEQQRLARALSGSPAPTVRGSELPITHFPSTGAPRPHSVAWVKAERGHAVLATDTAPSDADIPAGWEAIAGMWADRMGAADPSAENA